jgi:hypothetical protein
LHLLTGIRNRSEASPNFHCWCYSFCRLLFGEQKRQNPPREILGSYSRKAQQP